AMLAMTGHALRHVDRFSGTVAATVRQPTGPSHFIRADVDDAGLRVHRGAAPLSTTVEAGEDHRLFPDAERNERSGTSKGAEFLQGELVCFGSSLGQHVFGQGLAREWLGKR